VDLALAPGSSDPDLIAGVCPAGVHVSDSEDAGFLTGCCTECHAGSAPLKLYTLYSPPNHRDGVAHQTRAGAEKDNEHFDGKTTE